MSFSGNISLSPLTQQYINENGGNAVDLRQLAAKVNEEIKKVEAEASQEFVNTQAETKSLLMTVEKNVRVLYELEEMLHRYKLTLISEKNSLDRLQAAHRSRSSEQKEARALSRQFAEFTEAVVVERKLADTILHGRLNDDFRASVARLGVKLAALRGYSASGSPVVVAALTQAEALARRAAELVQPLFASQIECIALHPQELREFQKKLEADRSLMFFLRDHVPDVFAELSRAYIDAASSAHSHRLSAILSVQTRPGAEEEAILAAVEAFAVPAAEETRFLRRLFAPMEEDLLVFYAMIFRTPAGAVIQYVSSLSSSIRDPNVLRRIGQSLEQLATKLRNEGHFCLQRIMEILIGIFNR